MAALAFYLAYVLRAMVDIPIPLRLGPFTEYRGLLAIQTSSLLITFFLYRLYHLPRGGSRIDLFYAIVSATSISSLIATALSFLTFRDSNLTRGVIIYNWALSIALVSLGRLSTGWLARAARRREPDRLLLVGTGDIARMILQKTLQSRLGYRVIGFVDGEASSGDIAGVPILGNQAQLGQIVREQNAQEVVIALPEATHDQLLDMILACEREHATVRIFPDFFQIIAPQLRISDLDGLPLLTVRDVALRGGQLAMKRMVDLAISGVGLVLLSPFLLFVALLVKLESKGPVFYSQERVGLDEKPFPMLKFRSMRVDAEKETGPVWATADDPRRTRLGSFLRAKSIDELPQLINVLLGEMSLVGPRPERPVFVDQFKRVVPRYMERHKEKAGLTGWAQVNGLRGDTSIIERTKYDLYYIENWSLFFDLKILVRQVANWFRKERNAY